ncbi:hypothetical protein [Romboutsia ilealis]|uniref:hypothetical protein n=1 Tax=Romboutsia ilealis TaxID=1115758 RepID=UPI00272A60A9|nr:hypothetical protein [Romboutsia ilealis]
MSTTELNTIIQQKQEDGSFVKLYPVTKFNNVKDEEGNDLGVVLEDKAQKDHNHDYVSDVPSTVEVGGIEKGFVTEGMTMEEILFKLLHKYVAPGISFSSSPNGGTYEIGSTVNTVNLTATGRRESDKIERIRFYKNNTIVEEVTNTSNTGNVTATYDDTNITTNTSYKADVYDGRSNVTSGTVSFNFVHPLYIGALDPGITNPTSADIKSMTKKIVGRGNQENTYTIDNKRMCIACPPNWTLKSIIDPSSFDITASFAKMTVPVECLDGSTQNYNVYLSSPTSQTNFKVKFNV